MKKTAESHGRLSISADDRPRELVKKSSDLKGVWKAKVITLFPKMFPKIRARPMSRKSFNTLPTN